MLHQEQHYTVPKLAKLWDLSDDTIRELVRNESGVLVISRPETRSKRAYTTFSIPDSVAKRIHERIRNK